MEKSVVIVGAGIAGLSAGCYARMNGYKTTILEMHNIPEDSPFADLLGPLFLADGDELEK